MHHSHSIAISTSTQFEIEYRKKIQLLLMNEPVHRGPAHAMKDDTTSSTHELMYVSEAFSVSAAVEAWQEVVRPNLPWAEDHFNERISGEPLNPPPSEQYWPYARQGNAEHKKDQIFSHTYPERFWPKYAGEEQDQVWDIDSETGRSHYGIRFRYGDAQDLIEVLKANINSRQAYLPIWFPEDLTAAVQGERVPCSMGYHFIMNKGRMDCVYTLRSCDLVRFYRDDIYMAGRLLHWVAFNTGQLIGNLIVNIDNLHCFPGDRPYLESLLKQPNFRAKSSVDKRANYNFEALG